MKMSIYYSEKEKKTKKKENSYIRDGLESL